MRDQSTPDHRLCTRCGESKPIADFYVHKSRPDGYDRWCKPCKRASSNDYRLRHLDNVKERKREYAKRNRAAITARQQEWVDANRDHLKQYQADRRERLRDHLRQYRREYFRNNRHAKQVYTNRRKAAPGSFTVAEWTALVARCDFRCLACGRQEPDIKLTVDHVVPLSRGGTNDIGNIQPLCVSCNSSKANRQHDYRPWIDTTRAAK